MEREKYKEPNLDSRIRKNLVQLQLDVPDLVNSPWEVLASLRSRWGLGGGMDSKRGENCG